MFATAGLPVYVRPQIDSLRRADAIFVLGGYNANRNLFALELAKSGWAPTVVISGGYEDKLLWNRCWLPRPPVNTVCFTPEPGTTTKGEGAVLRRLADRFGWHRVIVVTFKPHISRARYILEKCFEGELIMVASPGEVPLSRWAYEYVYQTAGFIKAASDPSC